MIVTVNNDNTVDYCQILLSFEALGGAVKHRTNRTDNQKKEKSYNSFGSWQK